MLLIGCANVAGLLLARAASRRTEIAIRTAIGAGRWRIVRQLITESVPLSLLGGLAGIFLAWGGLRLFVAAAPPGFPRLNELSLDLPVLGFTALVAILTAVIFGIVPAIQASNPDLVGSLKESGRSGTDGVARQHLRSALVTIQIAMALVLLIGAGLMINSFLRIQNNPLGADPKNLLTFDFRFSRDEAIKPFGKIPERRPVGCESVDDADVPAGVRTDSRFARSCIGRRSEHAATGRSAGHGLPDRRTSGTAAGYERPALARPRLTSPSRPIISQLCERRLCRAAISTIAIRPRRPFVVIINQTMAKRFWPNESPIGKQIRMDYVPDEPLREIVGVAGDIRMNRQQRQLRSCGLRAASAADSALDGRWICDARGNVLCTCEPAASPLALTKTVRQAMAEVDRNKPVANIRTVEDYLDQQVQYVRLYVLLLASSARSRRGLRPSESTE